MPKPRKTTTQLALSGTLKKHPGRYRQRVNEPVVEDPIGPPPDGMVDDATAAWQRLAVDAPWLRSADRPMLEVACRLFAAFRNGEVRLTGQLITALSKLGFTPADRARVGVPGAGEPVEDEFADFR